MGYAPYIEPVLPAQAGSTLKIPYTPARGYAESTVPKYAKVLDMNSEPVGDRLTKNMASVPGAVSFDAPTDDLVIGNYYKIQIAYEADGNPDAYSYAGVFKWCAEPNNVDIAHDSSGEYTAYYFYPIRVNYSPKAADEDEKAVRYKFDIYAANNTTVDMSSLVETSGWITENNYYPKYSLNQRYAGVKVTVETVNGLTAASSDLPIKFTSIAETVAPELTLVREKGAVLVSCNSTDVYATRRLSNGGPVDEPIVVFDFNSASPAVKVDYTVMQGETYSYGAADPIAIDFEDMYLSDANGYCLPIKYDPKVSSFKTTILESRQDTIGGKYPVFFRNKQVKYNTFPISGLITRLMKPTLTIDPIREATATNANLTSDFSTSLTAENVAAERRFKQEVLEWLNNGEPKLFRSPTEGNFIVRLMDVSLSPNDTLGRMLHSFSCTAYECEEYNGENLQKFIVRG